MPRQLGFFVDSASCSGCKACQAACQDKHDLPAGMRWRRVYEIGGGGWRREGDAWASAVTAYNLSLACNHCEDPLCLKGCPSGAIAKREEDGIVEIDPAKCLGCRYCEWVCPYGAPQFDPSAGVMTKCDFCTDELAEGNAPVCVTACPMRALAFGKIEDLRRTLEGTPDLPPLPSSSITRPALVIKPHRTAGHGRSGRAAVSNREEVKDE